MKEEPEIFEKDLVREILGYYKKEIWTIRTLLDRMYWDKTTYMPGAGYDNDLIITPQLTSLMQRAYLDGSFKSKVDQAMDLRLNPYELRAMKLIKKDIDEYELLSSEFVEKMSFAETKAYEAWLKAREKDDFSVFSPFLSRVVELKIKKAEMLGYGNNPYDYYLGLHAEGWTTVMVKNFFDKIRGPLKEMLGEITSSNGYSGEHEFDYLENPFKGKEREFLSLCREILRYFGYDEQVCRLDMGNSPFTVNASISDVRMTTFLRFLGIQATSHEWGHCLHSLQLDEMFARTPLQEVSSDICESQSFFWQHCVGRNVAFIEWLAPRLAKIVPSVNFDNLYSYWSLVRPGLIRTKSDEITYHSAIDLRIYIESGLFDGSISVNDIPRIWSDKTYELLGVRPDTDVNGSLQDPHWTDSPACFIVYTLGAFGTGFFQSKMEEDIGPIEMILRERKIETIKDWLRVKVHRHGGMYSLNDLVLAEFQEEFTPKPHLNYLRKRYV